jgi:hypothetical protein
MEVGIIAAIICCILLIAGFAVLFTKVLTARHDTFSPEELFSPERYRAMERLLDEADTKFISSHSGCTRRLEKNFRKGRIRIFRAYLQLLSKDFHGLCKALRLHMIACKVDRSDLAAVVVKEQFHFAAGIVYVEFKLIAFASGWSGVDASRLIQSIDAMRDRLQSLAALPEPTLA